MAVVYEVIAGLNLFHVRVGKILNHLLAHVFDLSLAFFTSTKVILTLLHLGYVVNEVALNLKIVLSLIKFVATSILSFEKLGNIFVYLFDAFSYAISLLLDISLSLFHNFHFLA